MNISPGILLAAALIIVVAYFIRGITGFGSGLIAVPLLAQFLPLTIVVPVILITDFSASLILGVHTRTRVRWDEIRPLLFFGILGVLLGTRLLLNLPQRPLLLILGTLVFVFGARNLFKTGSIGTVSRWWAAPAGIFGGTLSALFGTGGPPYVSYLTHRLHDKAELRASFSGLFLIEGGIRIAVFLIAGLLLDSAHNLMILVCLPFMTLGLYLGNHTHNRVSSLSMQHLIGTILVGSGLSLVIRAYA